MIHHATLCMALSTSAAGHFGVTSAKRYNVVQKCAAERSDSPEGKSVRHHHRQCFIASRRAVRSSAVSSVFIAVLVVRSRSCEGFGC